MKVSGREAFCAMFLWPRYLGMVIFRRASTHRHASNTSIPYALLPYLTSTSTTCVPTSIVIYPHFPASARHTTSIHPHGFVILHCILDTPSLRLLLYTHL